MFDRRQNNIDVFMDTEKICKTNLKLIDAINKSNSEQVMIQEKDPVEVHAHRYESPVEVIVSKKRSLEAARAYIGQKVCVHNFASATNPGGGVTKGSNAQEEAICRCSSLYFNIATKNLYDEFYNRHRQLLRSGEMTALYNDDCIYTSGVWVMKSDTSVPELLPETEWYQVDMITCAAPNLRERPSNSMNPGSGNIAIKISIKNLIELHVKRMSRICDIAIDNKDEVLILGAFGCGAFSNSPFAVAEAMARVIEKYKFDFKVIEFAVYCSPNDTKNYDVFLKHLGEIESDGRLTEPSDGKRYRLRDAIALSKD